MDTMELLYKELCKFRNALLNILDEPYDTNNSMSRAVSPSGVQCYNRIAQKFNLCFPQSQLVIFREDTTPNIVTHPKPQEILYQLEFALDIVTDHLEIQNTYLPIENEDTIKNEKTNNKVFIVHGHDNGAKQTAARFLEQCGLVPIILHEQADSGRTIIEKIEQCTDVVFAIVLYTPCDVGYEKNEKIESPRARQNVVFEHGYLIGKLGRKRVCALVEKGVQLPGDISGVIYKSMDKAGAWKNEILREMNTVGIAIDTNKLL